MKRTSGHKTQNSRHKTGNRKQATGSRTPLAEGIIPLDKRGRRSWSSLADDKLITYAKRSMKESGITRRGELQKADEGLYEALRRRALLDGAGFKEKRPRRSWKQVNDGVVLEYAIRLIKKEGISRKSALEKADTGLCHVLRKRRLLGKLGLKEKKMRKKRPWKEMNDDQLIEFTKTFFKDNRITRRAQLQKTDCGLYQALKKRGLLDRVGFEDKRRPWVETKDEQVIEYAKSFMKKRGISGKGELQNSDRGLYTVLRKRGLLDKVVFVGKRRPWKKMNDDELVEFTKTFMKEKGITRRTELSRADKGLYFILCKRGLIDSVGCEDKLRYWDSISDEELIKRVRRFIQENGISRISWLQRIDPGVYIILGKRGLRDKVGFRKKRVTRRWKELSDEQVILIAKRLIKKKGIISRNGLERADKGLHHVLTNRGLLDKLGLKKKKIGKRRPWKGMEDEELIEHAKTFMKENGISRRSELSKADQGLYGVLRKRKLLDRVFSDIEKSQSEKAIEQIIDFTASFGERG